MLWRHFQCWQIAWTKSLRQSCEYHVWQKNAITLTETGTQILTFAQLYVAAETHTRRQERCGGKEERDCVSVCYLQPEGHVEPYNEYTHMFSEREGMQGTKKSANRAIWVKSMCMRIWHVSAFLSVVEFAFNARHLVGQQRGVAQKPSILVLTHQQAYLLPTPPQRIQGSRWTAPTKMTKSSLFSKQESWKCTNVLSVDLRRWAACQASGSVVNKQTFGPACWT